MTQFVKNYLYILLL